MHGEQRRDRPFAAAAAAELQAIGYAAVVFPVAATYAVARTLAELFATLKRTGTTACSPCRLLDFVAFTNSSACRRARARARCRNSLIVVLCVTLALTGT